MKKSMAVMIVCFVFLTSFLWSQDAKIYTDRIAFEGKKNNSTSGQEVYAPSVEENKFTFLVRADYFLPSEKLYKDVYESGIYYGAEITFSVWKSLSVYLSASYLSKKGSMIPLGEDTSLSIIPVEVGAIFKLSKKKISPYFGGGSGYYYISEDSFLGKVTGGGIGFFGLLGVKMELIKSILLDISAKYNISNVTIEGISNNIGGIRFGLGIGTAF